ncbi:transcription termination factor MTERF15, mitochondrial [Quercus suber]|uniref:Transcription termination factor mterf8 n=1 Tax=Quercus suber TaxID=58331 RepID=A0AAW0LI88_QUESU|nr:transcription termination factor MTERF15, mitochondrial-like [Quercus suber]POF15088.1 transcription termination factor mterf8, chloroplastic [Quercus suber]
MLNFLYKAIHHRSCCTVETHIALLLSSGRLRYISSTSTSNQHSFTVSYLINSCGFSPEAALSASKYVNFENPHKADLVISFFKHHGFSQTQISNVIREHPGVLVSDPHKTLLPKLEFFHSKGFTTSDIATVLSRNSRILKRSLKNQIIPSFVFLKNLLGTDGNTIAAVRCFPGILVVKLDTHVVPNINLLRENGVPESNICASIKKYPRFITTGAIRFKGIVEEVKEMGFNPLGLSFILAIFAIKGMNKSTWERKVNAYKRWGLSEEEILVAFGRSPHCIMASEDKIMRVMDFLVNQMGLEASLIVKRPQLLTYSLEKRLIPRASVIQVLQSKGLVKKLFYLPAVFEYAEELFLQKFVMPYGKEASELLQLYKERLVFPE